jgi:RNA polymerase sigma factor (TIGR02999 family)
MNEFREGDREAAGHLVEHFYPELRRMAGLQIRQERPDHTLQATALVNELYLQLMRVKNLPPAGSDDDSERRLFLGLAGFLMKRMLIHHARPLRQQFEKMELVEGLAGAVPGEGDLVEVEELLAKLGQLDPVLAQVVQLRVFDGLTREQIAERLDTSVRTVARHWEFARRWLSDALSIPDRG